MEHVYGHANKYLLEAEMSPAQQVIAGQTN